MLALSEFTLCFLDQLIPLETFHTQSATGQYVPILPGGHSIALTFCNRQEYSRRALHLRLHEMDAQVAAVRAGMACIVPVPLLSLVTTEHLEQLICGIPQLSVSTLRKIVRLVIVLQHSDVRYNLIAIDTVTSQRSTRWLNGCGISWRNSQTKSACCSCALCPADRGCRLTQPT